MIFKRNLKNFIFCLQNYPERCSPRTVCNNLLHTVAICSTVCNNLLQSEARMATLCNKKKMLLHSVAIRATLCNKLLHTVSLLHTVVHHGPDSGAQNLNWDNSKISIKTKDGDSKYGKLHNAPPTG